MKTKIALVVILVLAAAGLLYRELGPAPPAPPERAAPPEPPAPLPLQPPAPPPVRHPLPLAPAAARPAQPLPPLDESDPAVARALGALVGSRSFAALFRPQRIIFRIVATVDSLPRAQVPVAALPVHPADGLFETRAGPDGPVVAPENASRYQPYVAALEAVNARALVDLYVRFYPLFQRAYEQLGYPHAYFNDRLIEALDDMIDAPVVDGPVRLVQPKVLYQFADPQLESQSAGRKLMIRLGPANAARVRAKLRQIHDDLLRRSGEIR